MESDSDQRQHSWRTDSGGLGYGCSAYRRVTRQGRSSAPHSDWTETHGGPRICGQDGDHSSVRGTRTLDAELLQQEEAEAKAGSEKPRPALTMFTDGSRLDDGAVGYAVLWKNGQSWVGIKSHMGYNQEAYHAECAALARP